MSAKSSWAEAAGKEKPMAGFIISLIGACFYVLNGVAIAAIGGMIAGIEWFGLTGAIFIALGLIFGFLPLIGAILIYAQHSPTLGGILVLVFGIIGIIIGGGFLIGLILCIVGGALALTGK